MNYDLIKSNYDKRLWGAQLVQLAVQKGVITQEQADAIRAGAADPQLVALQSQLDTQRQINEIITGGETA